MKADAAPCLLDVQICFHPLFVITVVVFVEACTKQSCIWMSMYMSYSLCTNIISLPLSPQPSGAFTEGDGESETRALWGGHHLFQRHCRIHHPLPLQHPNGGGWHAQWHLQELWQHPGPPWCLQGTSVFSVNSGAEVNVRLVYIYGWLCYYFLCLSHIDNVLLIKQSIHYLSGWDNRRCVHGCIRFAQTQRWQACSGHRPHGPGHAGFCRDVWVAAPAWNPSVDPYWCAFR